LRIADYQGGFVTRAEFEARTKRFALAIVQLVEELPVGRTADVIGKQLLRAGTSVGANYRASCRSRSRREFIAKMGIVEEEADEAQFWLDLLIERGVVDRDRAVALRREASELVAITVSSIRTARRAPRSNPQSAIRNPQSSRSAIRNPQCS
jgi:four helix bundle protein